MPSVNPAYAETFRRHRRLLLLPVAVATVIAVWSTVAAPPMYQSATSIWSDTADGSAQAYGAPPPAAQEQSILAELLTTDLFRNAVARRSGLARYLVRNPSEGWGPTSLVGRLRGAASLDSRIAIALGPKRVLATPEGPHILKISFEAPTPRLAVLTLRALVARYISQRSALRADALRAYRSQVEGATATLTKARGGIASYLLQHPNRANSRSSPQLAAMLHSERTAFQQLGSATKALNQQSAAVLGSISAGTTLRVVDPAKVPTTSISSPKKLVKGLLAGIFAGALISVLGVVALTKTRRTTPEKEDTAPAAHAAEPGELGAPRGESLLGGAFGQRRTGSG